MHRTIAVVVCLCILACARQRAPLPTSSLRLDDRACAGAVEWRRCVRDLERLLVAEVPGVRRDSTALQIAIPGGTAIVLQDSVDEHGVGYHYLYRAYEPRIGAHFVEVQLYEGGFVRMISATTGKSTALDALPQISPNGKRLLTASWDTEAGYDPNRVRIIRLQKDSGVVEWEMEPQLWGPDDPKWLDDSTVQVSRRPALGHPDSTALKAPLTIRWRAAVWHVDSTLRAP